MTPKLARLFFGGRGLGIAYLYKHFLELKEKRNYRNPFLEVHPLSKDNIIVISTSPATGTRMPTSGRIHMNFKSPLTGALGSTNGGGRFGVDFKKTGHDILVITGKAQDPCYLVISNDGVVFNDAREVTSLGSIEIRTFIRNTYGKKTQVLTIGQGGINQSYFASVMSDTGKALGRGGGGAVFGAKNLVAITVIPDPDSNIEVADNKSLELRNRKGPAYQAKLKFDVGKFTKKENNYGILSSMGSLGILGMVYHFGQLIHNNMNDTHHDPDDVNKISGEALKHHAKNATPGKTKLEVGKSACFNCPIVCKRKVKIIDEEGRHVETGEGPEFESVALLGANLSIYDLPLIVKANNLSNFYGLDTISLGATIASFFELYTVVKNKKDPLSKQETLFMSDVESFTTQVGEPAFGAKDLLLPLIHLIGKGEGIGAHLAMGSHRFCIRYGHQELSMSVKKLELPAYDPRTSFTQALCYEMNNRGGCHLEGGYVAPHAYCAGYAEWPAQRIEGTPLIAKNAALKNTTLDVIGACAYGSFSLNLDEYARLIKAVTGDEHNAGTLQNLAAHTITLERYFNHLCGLTKEDDCLPDRFYTNSIKVNDKHVVCDRQAFGEMKRKYYLSFGWDADGIPLEETLKTLGVFDAIEALENETKYP